MPCTGLRSLFICIIWHSSLRYVSTMLSIFHSQEERRWRGKKSPRAYIVCSCFYLFDQLLSKSEIQFPSWAAICQTKIRCFYLYEIRGDQIFQGKGWSLIQVNVWHAHIEKNINSCGYVVATVETSVVYVNCGKQLVHIILTRQLNIMIFSEPCLSSEVFYCFSYLLCHKMIPNVVT